MTDKKKMQIAIEALEAARHKYAVRCSGSQINFDFGQKAKKHSDR